MTTCTTTTIKFRGYRTYLLNLAAKTGNEGLATLAKVCTCETLKNLYKANYMMPKGQAIDEKPYIVTIGNQKYKAINGVFAKKGDKVAYEWNPNNEIDTVVSFENGGDILVGGAGRGEAKKFHKLIELL